MKRASIDLGTNTCLLLIANWDEKSKTVTDVVEDLSTIVRLGQQVDQNKKLHPDAIQRTKDCLRNYAEVLKKHQIKPESVIAIATSQARDSSNALEFFQSIQDEFGIKFQVLSGQQEAQYSYLGALKDHSLEAVVIDIGGGSTELISKKGGESLDIGSVRFTERYLKSDPVTDEEFWRCQKEIDLKLESLKPWRKSLALDIELVGVAGTVVSVACWMLGSAQYDAQKIDQLRLTRGDVHRLVEELKWRSVRERIEMVGIEEKRADVLLAGVMILWRAMEVLDFKSCLVSTRGLRYGVLSKL